jgi:hypothetical protein
MRRPWVLRRGSVRLPEPAGGGGSREPPCLVHLVREVNGLEALRGFAGALRAHPPGTSYELVLAMKGFSSPAQAGPYLAAVEDLAPRVLFFADRGFDLGVYFATAAQLRRNRYCFVNSFARPLVDGWLAKLDGALARPGVGQVGATGLWASGHSWQLYSAGLPSVYRGLLPPPPEARRLLREMGAEARGERHAPLDVLRARLRLLGRLPEILLCYEPFPARFLRTNAFMIAHEVLRELKLLAVHSKIDAYALEGSRASITHQLRRQGLSSLVVDRAGAVYEPERWSRSRTLWQGDQEGLLVADNQTLPYANGDFARRRLLSTIAWGPCADPRPPGREDPDVRLRARASGEGAAA